MVCETLKEKLSDRRKGWHALLVVGPPGAGKTYVVSSVAKEMGFKVIKISLASRENPIKSIISAIEEQVSSHWNDDGGLFTLAGIKSFLLGKGYVAEDVLLASLAYFLELLFSAEDNTLIVIDDVIDTYHDFVANLVRKLKSISTDNSHYVVVVMREEPKVYFPLDHVIRINEGMDSVVFIKRFGQRIGMLLWEITNGNLGLASFIYNHLQRMEGIQTLDGFLFSIWESLSVDEQMLLSKLAVWGYGYEGFFTLEIYDLLTEYERRIIRALIDKGILEEFVQGGFRFASLTFMYYVLRMLQKDIQEKYACVLFEAVISGKKMFLMRRAYFVLNALGYLRRSRYLILLALRYIFSDLSRADDTLIGVKEHFLSREDVPLVEKIYVASHLWWLNIYDESILRILKENIDFLRRRSYLGRYFSLISAIFLGEEVDILTANNHIEDVPTLSFLDKLYDIWYARVWDNDLELLYDRISDSLHPMWSFIVLYVKAKVTFDTYKKDAVYKLHDIATELGNPVFLIESVKLLLDVIPLSQFDDRIDILSKAYRIAPPTSDLFERIVADMVANFREVSEQPIIEEFIDFLHYDFHSIDHKEELVAQAVFHYMVIGNLPRAKLFLAYLQDMNARPVVISYLQALYAVLIGSKAMYERALSELLKFVERDNTYIQALTDMAEVWLYDKEPVYEYDSLSNQTSIVLWYLSVWKYAAYYQEHWQDENAISFFDDVIDALSSAGMEFAKHMMYVYKGYILYKRFDILRSREYFKSAYTFFRKAGYRDRASNVAGMLTYVRPDSDKQDWTAKDIFLSWSSYYRRVDAIASLYESLIDMLLYVGDADNVSVFLDRLISEMLYILVAEKMFIFAYRDGEVKYFKAYGLGSGGTLFSKNVKAILREGSKLSYSPSYMQALYRGSDYTIGLFAESAAAGTFDEIHLSMAEKVLKIVESVLVGNEVRQLAIYDSLTGLYTRWYFSIRFNEEFYRSLQDEKPLAVLYLDIDDFKKINDRYGHLEGDEVLRRVGYVIKSSIRSVDMPSRYGGEEIVVMLLGSNIEDAYLVGDRLRQNIQNAFVDKPYRVTVSVGVAGIPEIKVDTPDKLIQKADVAMYIAKRTGKNRVVKYEPHMDKLYEEP